MGETEYVVESRDTFPCLSQNQFEKLLEDALDHLSEKRLSTLAKNLKVQVDGFRLKNAPKSLVVKELLPRLRSPLGFGFLLEAIKKDYPELFFAINEKDKKLEIDKWQETCSDSIIILALISSNDEKNKDLIEQLIKKQIEKKELIGKETKVISLEQAQENNRQREVERLEEKIEQKNQLISEKDRLLAKKGKELKKLEDKLKEERVNYGKSSSEVGELRKENETLQKQLNDLQQRLEFYQDEQRQLKDENRELEAQLTDLNKEYSKQQERSNHFGKDLSKLLEKKQSWQKEALKWEARWQVESFLKEKSAKKKLISKEISVDVSELESAYIKVLRLEEKKLLSDFSEAKDIKKRKDILTLLEESLLQQEKIEAIDFGTDSVSLNVDIDLDCDDIIFCYELEGIFSYEGPHGWVRTDEGSFLITPEDIFRHNLVTGDTLKVFLNHSIENDSDTGISFEIINKAEHIEQVCSLQRVDDEILVNNTYSYDLQLSPAEFESIGCNLEDPVTVIFPKLSSVQKLNDKIIYARVIKAHDYTWQEMPPKERKRCEKRRIADASTSNKEQLEPILKGQTILVVGGDRFKEQLRDIIEQKQGIFCFQPGFDEKGMVESRVKKSQRVILVTSELSHVVKDLVIKATEKHNVDCCYYNERGAVLFEELIRSFTS